MKMAMKLLLCEAAENRQHKQSKKCIELTLALTSPPLL
jgi:hypothetical protein